ncbi:MAG: hypothetical protein HGA31_06055 [Candidatus Moranbacteria bacterium]|nr:hypothetical protein [Candidatus Moranbacteria bacterium]
MHLKCIFYPNREHAGELVIEGIDKCYVCTKSIYENEAEPGSYRLLKVIRFLKRDAVKAFGTHALLFGNEATRRILFLHGGDPDAEGRLLPTAGGLRVSDEDLLQILSAIDGEDEVVLDFKEKEGLFAGAMHPRVSSWMPRIDRVSNVSRSKPINGISYDIPDDTLLFWLQDMPATDGYPCAPGFSEGSGAFAGGGSTADMPLPDHLYQSHTDHAIHSDVPEGVHSSGHHAPETAHHGHNDDQGGSHHFHQDSTPSYGHDVSPSHHDSGFDGGHDCGGCDGGGDGGGGGD